MDKALHPTTRKLISVDEYKRKLGLGDIGGGEAEAGLCPCCLGSMRLGAPAQNVKSSYFYHATQGSNCPTIKPNEAPYAWLPDPVVNLSSFEEGKRFLRENWIDIYKIFKGILPATTVDEFFLALSEAKRRRLLEYSDLSWPLLPYYLVALGNFTTKTGISRGKWKRRYSFRFYFQQDSRSGGKLWIEKRIPMPLFRMSYNSKGIVNVDSPIELVPVSPTNNASNILKPWELEKSGVMKAAINKMFAPAA